MSARNSKDPVTFIAAEDQEKFISLLSESFEVQVGLHELLGHGSGKLFQENKKGEFNFHLSTKNPLNDVPVKNWYKAGETWDSKFPGIGSSYEGECVTFFFF